MSKILKFKEFLNEKFQLNPNDPPEITSQKRNFNDIAEHISEYNNKKVTLDNIYKTYVDDKDLINKLKAQKLLEGNPSDIKTIKFLNPLLAIHAQISRKMRQISDIQKLIKSDQDTIQNKEGVVDANAEGEVKNSLQNDISDVQQKISSKNEEIKKLDSEINILKKQIDAEISKIKKQLSDSQKRINTEQFT